MIVPDIVVRLLSVLSVGIVFKLIRMGLGLLDRRIAPPIMRERVNEASDRFFTEDARHWGESEIDTIFQNRVTAEPIASLRRTGREILKGMNSRGD